MTFTVDSAINKNAYTLIQQGPDVYPNLCSSNREELLACRTSAWIGCALCITPTYNVTGPDAAKLLNKICVNRDFSLLKINGSRHALMCNDKGYLLADGVITRLDEETFRSYWLAPVLEYYVESSGLNVKGHYVTDEYFYQVDGPKSLEIMEKACQCDLHDMKFAGQKKVRIGGTDMTIIRLGMSGCLGYEMHGSMEHADMVFDKLLEAGAEFGARQLGLNSYTCNHTQAGYPNQFIHYWYPIYSSGQAMADFIRPRTYSPRYDFIGSANDDENNYFVTPYDIDWDYLIRYDHDFIGRAALEEIAKNPPNKVVTLEWNAEDVGDVFASQFRGADVEPYDDLAQTGERDLLPRFTVSKVLLDGKVIGRASGRTHDYYHRREISLAFLAKEYAVEGKEVVVLWGTNGRPQKEIRAKIAPFPYYNEEYRNEKFDVSQIPQTKFD